MLVYIGILHGVYAFLQCCFALVLVREKHGVSHYILFVSISYLLLLGEIFLPLPEYIPPVLDGLFTTGVGVGVLYAFLRLKLKQQRVTAFAAACLIKTTSTLVESLVYPLISLVQGIGSQPAFWPMVAEGAALLGIYFLLVQVVRGRYWLKAPGNTAYLLLLALPLLFISIVLRTLQVLYDGPYYDGAGRQSAAAPFDSLQYLIVALLALACVLGVILLFAKAAKYLQGEEERKILELQLACQRQYMQQARERYEQTRAFRHDFNNHILALSGLLQRREWDKAQRYVTRFEEASQGFSPPLSTGNTVLDLLLSEKIPRMHSLHIVPTWDIGLPARLPVDDFDLCALVANALDNAIKGCCSVPEEARQMHLLMKPKDQFLLLEITNRYTGGKVPRGQGLGRKTMHWIVAKYDGFIEEEGHEGQYRLSVILPFALKNASSAHVHDNKPGDDAKTLESAHKGPIA